ncbi:retrovirus-related pol polyprotein from transposon TNT 1-94, partial [Tanacetum coccineum]
IEVGKFTFHADFVILEMEEDTKVPLILGRPFLHIVDAVIRVKQKQLNLGVGTERMNFNIDFEMKNLYISARCLLDVHWSPNNTRLLFKTTLRGRSLITGAMVMDAPTLPISAERNLGDPIEIRVDIVHPAPVDVFPAATVVRTLAQHGEAIRGIHGHLQGVPINEEVSALRFRMGMAEEENASLRGRFKTMEATDKITRRQEKRARMELE